GWVLSPAGRPRRAGAGAGVSPQRVHGTHTPDEHLRHAPRRLAGRFAGELATAPPDQGRPGHLPLEPIGGRIQPQRCRDRRSPRVKRFAERLPAAFLALFLLLVPFALTIDAVADVDTEDDDDADIPPPFADVIDKE